MAEEKSIHYDINLNGNVLKDAKVPTTTFPNEEDVINRKYVDDKTSYNSGLAENLPTVEKVGGIESGTTDLNGKPFSEIIDRALYPLLPAVYETPTVSLSISNITDIILHTGFRTDIVLEANVDIKDSAGITSYTFTGTGIDTPITQSTNIFTVNNLYLIDGENSWNVVVEYDAGVPKNNSHDIPDIDSIFASGNKESIINLEAKRPILYGVYYRLLDSTEQTPSNVPFSMESVIDNVDSFEVELGNTEAVSFNIGVPYKDYVIRVLMNDIDVTNSFKNEIKQGIRPWDEPVGGDYNVYHWYSNIALSEITKMKVFVYKKDYDRIVDMDFDSQDNSVSFDNVSTNYQAWDFGTDTPFAGTPISIRSVEGYLKLNSDIGTIKKIEKSRPFNVAENLDFLEAYIKNEKGVATHLYGTEKYNLRIWISNTAPAGDSTQTLPTDDIDEGIGFDIIGTSGINIDL